MYGHILCDWCRGFVLAHYFEMINFGSILTLTRLWCIVFANLYESFPLVSYDPDVIKLFMLNSAMHETYPD